MRTGVFLAGLLALGILQADRAAQAAARDESLSRPAEFAARARDIRIERRWWDEGAPAERPDASQTASREWLQQLVAAALVESGRAPAATCLTACRRCPEQLSVEVRFTVDSKLYILTLHMREGLAFLRTDKAVAWSFQDSVASVHRLLQAATPDDAYVQEWKPPPSPSPGPDPLADDDVLVTGMPESIRKVAPSYPDDAREAKVAGVVHVRALVGADGTVAKVRVAKSIALLDQAAMDAVRQWEFKPATCAGRPVAVWVTVPVRFTLR